MRNKTKVWIIIAASLVLIGCILFASVMTTLEWDFMKLETVKYKTNTYEIKEAFENISIDTYTADIVFEYSDDKNCRVECYEETNVTHSVTVENGTLTVDLIDERSANGLMGYIGINFGSPKVTVYLPNNKYANLLINGDNSDVKIPDNFIFNDVNISLTTGNVDFCASSSETTKINTSTGDISVNNISVGALDIRVTTGTVKASNINSNGDVAVNVATGKTYLSQIQCKNVITSGSTGDISLDNVIAKEKFSIERSTGEVKFTDSDAAEIFAKTNTGDVKGSFLTDKVFVVKTNTGEVDVPDSVTGGRCEIISNTGDIALTIQ